MSNKPLILAAAAGLLVLGGGAVCTIAVIGGYRLYRASLLAQERALICQQIREQSRSSWLDTSAPLAELQARSQLQLDEHRVALERASLVRDLESIERYEGLIMTTDNLLTSLRIANETVDSMQTSTLTLPVDELLQQTRLVNEMSWEPELAAIFSEPIQLTMTLQEHCVD